MARHKRNRDSPSRRSGNPSRSTRRRTNALRRSPRSPPERNYRENPSSSDDGAEAVPARDQYVPPSASENEEELEQDSTDTEQPQQENEEEIEQDSTDTEESSDGESESENEDSESESENEDNEDEDNDRESQRDTHPRMPDFPWERNDETTKTNPTAVGAKGADDPKDNEGEDDEQNKINPVVGAKEIDDPVDNEENAKNKTNPSVGAKGTDNPDNDQDWVSEITNITLQEVLRHPPAQTNNSFGARGADDFSEDEDRDRNEKENKDDDSRDGGGEDDGPKANKDTNRNKDIRGGKDDGPSGVDDSSQDEDKDRTEKKDNDDDSSEDEDKVRKEKKDNPPVGAKGNDDRKTNNSFEARGADDSSKDDDSSEDEDKDRKEKKDNPPVHAKGNDDGKTNNSFEAHGADDSSEDNDSSEDDDAKANDRGGEDDEPKANEATNRNKAIGAVEDDVPKAKEATNPKKNKKIDYDNNRVRIERRLGRKQSTQPKNAKNMKDKGVRGKLKTVAKNVKELQFCSTYGDMDKQRDSPGFINFLGSYDDIIPRTSAKSNFESDWDYQRKKGPKLTFLVDPAFDLYREKIGDQLISAGNWFKENECKKTGPYHTQTLEDYFDRNFGDAAPATNGKFKCDDIKSVSPSEIEKWTEKQMEDIVQEETKAMTTEEKGLFRRSVNAVMGEQQRYKKKGNGAVREGKKNCFVVAHENVNQKRRGDEKKKLASLSNSVQNKEQETEQDRVKKKKRKKKGKRIQNSTSNLPPHMKKHPPPGPPKPEKKPPAGAQQK